MLSFVSFNGEQVNVLPAIGHCAIVEGRYGVSRSCARLPGGVYLERIGRRTIISSWPEFCITFAWKCGNHELAGEAREGAFVRCREILTMLADIGLRQDLEYENE